MAAGSPVIGFKEVLLLGRRSCKPSAYNFSFLDAAVDCDVSGRSQISSCLSTRRKGGSYAATKNGVSDTVTPCAARPFTALYAWLMTVSPSGPANHYNGHNLSPHRKPQGHLLAFTQCAVTNLGEEWRRKTRRHPWPACRSRSSQGSSALVGCPGSRMA